MQRYLAGILAVFNVANGLVMLFAGSLWWNHVAGARETGPFNPHSSRTSARHSRWRAWSSGRGPGEANTGRPQWPARDFSPRMA
jgi:hypothetical protein